MIKFDKIPFEEFLTQVTTNTKTYRKFCDNKTIKELYSLSKDGKVTIKELLGEDGLHKYVEYVKGIYDRIKLPKRSTKGSAGYDFFSPFEFTISDGESITIPTGIRLVTDCDDIVLLIVVRSGLGFKGVNLYNQVGVIDSDYTNGIMVKLIKIDESSNAAGLLYTMISGNDLKVEIPEGKAIVQGIIVPYTKTDDDDNNDFIRKGGFGSTDNNEPEQMKMSDEIFKN